MIRRTASAAFLLRDGFTGATLTGGPATRCLLDGRPLRRPIWKKDGYLVLTDLAPGAHVLRLSRSGYRDEELTIEVRADATVEDTISLKPGVGYRFPRETVRVSLTLRRGDTHPGEALWIGLRPRTRLKLAQDKTEPGDDQARLFCDGSASLLPIPGHFLMHDAKAPELVYLRSLVREVGEFAPPLAFAHSRSTELIPMQTYQTDEAGAVELLLPEPGTLVGCCGGAVFVSEVSAGQQALEWKLEG
jgi:hypothetical protein